MSSLLARETKRLACVPLGGGEKKQVFETKTLDARTRGGLRREIKSVDDERDESGSTQDVHIGETPCDDPLLKDQSLDDDESLLGFLPMQKALHAPWTHCRRCGHLLHARKFN